MCQLVKALFMSLLSAAVFASVPAHAISERQSFAPENLHYSIDRESRIRESFNVRTLLDECKNGNSRSCLILGKACVEQYQISNEISYAQHGFSLFEQACSLRDSEGCYRKGIVVQEAVNLGLDVNRLFGVTDVRDVIIKSMTAGTMVQDEIIAGDSYAHLAEIYQSEDRDRAIGYARSGCDIKNHDACYLWGEMIWLNRVEEKDIGKYLDGADPDEAMIRAFSSGTEASSVKYRSQSYYFLGYQYGLKRYFDLSAQSYIKGCELNNANACFFAGISYEDGRGLARDMRKAYAHYKKSCSLGNSYGCERVRKLKLQGYN